MASSYPGSLDSLTNPASGDAMNSGAGHAAQHANANDAIEAIQTTLGVDPQGSYTDVAERLDVLPDPAGGSDGDVVTVDSGGYILTAGGGGGGGLVLIDSGTFSAASSVSLPNGSFSSTYDDYKLIFVPTSYSATGATSVYARFRASGTDETGSVYAWARGYSYNATGDGGFGAVSDTAITLGEASSNPLIRCILEIQSPYLTAYTSLDGQATMDQGTAYFISGPMGAHVRNTTQYDSLTIYPSTGTITGRWALYGYAK